MRETWLQPNRRAIGFGCVPAALFAALGLWMATADVEPSWPRESGIVMILVSATALALLVREMLRPRIAYHDGHVLFYLRSGPPFEVPLQLVEAFFLGQGPARLPGGAGREETVNLVARLTQRETQWAHRTVKPALGQWCDGYVTIRGTWCEPLGNDVIRRLNRRLKEVKTACHEIEAPS